MKRLVGVFLMAGLMILAVSGSAYCHHWGLTGRGDWSVDDNWRYNEPISTTNTAVEWGNPVVTQTGEVAQIIRLSGSYGNNPILEIVSGDLSVGEFLSLGYFQNTVGSLVMSGGKLTVPQLKVAQSTGSSASLDISGGILEAGYIVAGWGGGTSLVQTGGEIHTPELKIHNYYSNDNDSVYEFSGGVLNVGMLDIMSNGVDGEGYFEILSDAVDMTVWDAFNLQEGGRFTSVPGVTVKFKDSGRFNILSTNSAEISGVENLSLRYENLQPDAGEIEAAGQDMGAIVAGFEYNFAPEAMTLTANTHVRVMNNTDNNPGISTPDALYVRDIVLSRDSILELNGNNVYCQCFLNINGTVDYSGGGTLSFLDECHGFTATPDPNTLPNDGESKSEITVALVLDHFPVAGEEIIIKTDKGLLTDGLNTDMALTVLTDGNGQAVVSLIADTTEGTANIDVTRVSDGWETGCAVSIVAPNIQITANKALYMSMPGRSSSDPLIRTFNQFQAPEFTEYGVTMVPVQLKLIGPDHAYQTIVLDSHAKEKIVAYANSSELLIPDSVVTDADGNAEFNIKLINLYIHNKLASMNLSYLVSSIDLEASAYSGTVSANIDFSVVNNFNAIMGHYQNDIPKGPIWDPVNFNKLNPIAGTLAGTGVYAGGVTNLWANSDPQFNAFTCGGYQIQILYLFDSLRLASNPLDSYIFNGYDYGPVIQKPFDGLAHQAVMLWPNDRFYDDTEFTVILDPWMSQDPKGSIFSWRGWLSRIGIFLPALGTFGLVPFTAPGSSDEFVNVHYPCTGNLYPDEPYWEFKQTPAPKYSIILDCPVHLLLTDAAGNIAGNEKDPQEGMPQLYSQIPGLLLFPTILDDQTRGWYMEIPDAEIQIELTGYAEDNFSFFLSGGEQVAFEPYSKVPVLDQEKAILNIDPAGISLPVISFFDGRTVLPDSVTSLEYVGYETIDNKTITELKIENKTDVMIFGPLRLIIDGLEPDTVSVMNPDGTTSEGKPYIDLTGWLKDNMLAPGEEITGEIFFISPGNMKFSLNATLKGKTNQNNDLVARMVNCELGFMENWPMKQGNMHQTGRADFIVPAWKLNDSFFDTISWQTPPPGGENDGNTGGTSMTFFDGAGPSGTDIVLGTYHWPKGVQGMDRHTGEIFWSGNPDDGGEEIAEITPAFSNSGSTVYVSNRYTANNNPLMAFETVPGPSVFRHNGMEASPDNLGYGSPIIDTAGRIFMHGYYDRPRAGTDTGSAIEETWTAAVGTGTLKSEAAVFQDGDSLKVIGTGRNGNVTCYDGVTGAQLWSVAMGQMTDASPTIDPASGNIYISSGDHDIYVTGLDKDGNLLWSQAAVQLYDWEEGVNNRQRAPSAGCLSHDGTTYYFQTTSEQGDGKLYAVNTADGSLKWAFDTQSMGGDSWNQYFSSPIVTRNKIIVIGNNEGDRYYAVQDSGTFGRLLDILQVDEAGNARASATMDSFGQLYLPVRTVWTAGNGNGDVPDGSVRNLFSAFDIQSRQPVPDLSAFAGEFGKIQQISPGDLDQDLDVDGKDIARFVGNY